MHHHPYTSRLVAAVSNGGFQNDGTTLDPPPAVFNASALKMGKLIFKEWFRRVNLLFPAKSFLFIEGWRTRNKNPIKCELAGLNMIGRFFFLHYYFYFEDKTRLCLVYYFLFLIEKK